MVACAGCMHFLCKLIVFYLENLVIVNVSYLDKNTFLLSFSLFFNVCLYIKNRNHSLNRTDGEGKLFVEYKIQI